MHGCSDPMHGCFIHCCDMLQQSSHPPYLPSIASELCTNNNDMLTRAAATSALSSQAPALLVACADHGSFLHICAAVAPGAIVPFPHWETWKVGSPSSPPCNVLSAGLSPALRRPCAPSRLALQSPLGTFTYQYQYRMTLAFFPLVYLALCFALFSPVPSCSIPVLLRIPVSYIL